MNISYCSKCCCLGNKYLGNAFGVLISKNSTFKMPGGSCTHLVGPSSKFTSRPKAIHAQYEEAVKALNGLQSNVAVLEEIKKQRKTYKSNSISLTKKYLNRAGVSLDDLDTLPIIHLAGTKGKGSTCAFIESILREHGYKTGFFSSPHLVVVRERIRINGIPINEKDFTSYFWEVYDQLAKLKCDPGDMPPYFKFLTVLALKIFLKEDVDVAIIEVGIGGEHDSTNVIRRPVVCGISALDYDHTSLLGETIEEIAWQKAGIMKPSSPTFTVKQVIPDAFPILVARAKEKNVDLFVAPPLEEYEWGGRPIYLGLSGHVQFVNASLALQISHYFMKWSSLKSRSGNTSQSVVDKSCGKSFTLSQEDILALQNVSWPGRSQILVRNKTTFFLDGAHTILSIQGCVDWFNKVSPLHASPRKDVYKVLICNITGDRVHEPILRHLILCNFDLAIFTTNLVSKDKDAASDQTNFTVSDAYQIRRCQNLRKTWLRLCEERDSSTAVDTENGGNDDNMEKEDIPSAQACLTFQCIRDVLLWLSCDSNTLVEGHLTQVPDFPLPQRLREADHVQVLITGSLHLVGGFLGVLDPSMSHLSQDWEDRNRSSLADMVKKRYARAQSDSNGAR